MRTILVSAYACEPLKGSEQGVGWNWVLQMAKKNNLHVITRANNQVFIEEHLPKELESNIVFHYYDTPNLIKGLKNKAKGLYFYYFFWQLGILPLAYKIIKRNNIDYTMHLTMGSIWMPTFLYFFKTNFIWGPVGGGEGVPRPFLSSFPFKNRIIQNFRYCLRTTSIINPFIFFPSRKAKIIIARTHNTKEYIPRPFRNKTQVFLETSMENEIFNHMKKNSPSEKVELIFTGRLVPFKNVITLIKSLKYVEYDNYHLTIIGSGSEKKKLETELFKMELLHKVTFVKEVSRNEVIERLSKSDIYVFPSLREGGSWALMEAMAIGLPVICSKWSGMEIITDETSAIRLPVTNPDEMIKNMAKAISNLIENPTLRLNMGNAGRERVKKVFNWGVKGEFMEELLAKLDK